MKKTVSSEIRKYFNLNVNENMQYKNSHLAAKDLLRRKLIASTLESSKEIT